MTEYKVRWANFSSKEDTCVKEEDLNCECLLEDFNEARAKTVVTLLFVG